MPRGKANKKHKSPPQTAGAKAADGAQPQKEPSTSPPTTRRGSETTDAPLSATVGPKATNAVDEPAPEVLPSIVPPTAATATPSERPPRQRQSPSATQPEVRSLEVGDYRLFDTKIGQGAYGKVYLCKGPSPNGAKGELSTYAAKYIVFGDSASDSVAYKTALREATKERDFLSTLKAVPYILKLESLFIKERPSEARQRAKKEVILITEYCKGGDLKYGLQRIRKCFPAMRVAAAPVSPGWSSELGDRMGVTYPTPTTEDTGGSSIGLLHPHTSSSQAGTNSPVPEGLVRIIARQLMTALNGLKEANIVHLDIKPANILLTHPLDMATVNHLNGLSASDIIPSDLEIRLADFGFAKRIKPTDTQTHTHPNLSSPPTAGGRSVPDVDVSQTSPSPPSKSTSDDEGAPTTTTPANRTPTHPTSRSLPGSMSAPTCTDSSHFGSSSAPTVRDDGGTFIYMNLDRIEKKKAGFYDDLWAVGLVLYEMLTGGRPPEWPACKDERTHARNLSASPLPSFPYRPFLSSNAIDFILTILNPSRNATVEDMINHPWLAPTIKNTGCQTLTLPSVGEIPLSDYDVSYVCSTIKGAPDAAASNDNSSLGAKWSGPAASCLYTVFVHPSWKGSDANPKDVPAKVISFIPLHVPGVVAHDFKAAFSTQGGGKKGMDGSIRHLRSVLNDGIRPLLEEANETAPGSSVAVVWGVDVVQRATINGGQWYIAVLHDFCLKGGLLGWMDTLSSSVVANDEFARSKMPPVIKCAQWIKDARSAVGSVPMINHNSTDTTTTFPVLPTYLHPYYFEVDANSNLRLSLVVIVVDVLMVCIGQQPSLNQGKAGLKVRMFSAKALHSEVSREAGLSATPSTSAPTPFSLSSGAEADIPTALRVLGEVPGCIPIMSATTSTSLGAILELEWSVAVLCLCLVPSLPRGRVLAGLFRPTLDESSPEASSPTNLTVLEKLSTIRDFMKLHMHAVLCGPTSSRGTSSSRRPPAPLMSCGDGGYDMSDLDPSTAPSPLAPTGEGAHPSEETDGGGSSRPPHIDTHRVSTTSSTLDTKGVPSPTATVSPTTTEKGSPAGTPGFSTCPPSAMGSRMASTILAAHVDPTAGLASVGADELLPPAWEALCNLGTFPVVAARALVPLLTPVNIPPSASLADTKDAVVAAAQQLLLRIAESPWLKRPSTTAPSSKSATELGDVSSPDTQDAQQQGTPPVIGSPTAEQVPQLPNRHASMLIGWADLLLREVVPFLTRPADKLQVLIQATKFAYEVLTSVGVLYGGVELQEDEDLLNARDIAAECNHQAGEAVKELHKAVTLNGGLPRVFSMDMDYLCDTPVSKGNIGSSSSSMQSTPHMGSNDHPKPPSGLRTQSTKVGAHETVSEGSASPWYYLVVMRGLDIIREASKDEIYSHVTANFGIARELFDLLSFEAAHDKLRKMLPGQQADNGGASALHDLFINGTLSDMRHLETLLADHDGDHSALTTFALEVAEFDGGTTSQSQSHTQGNPPSDDDVE